MRIMGDEPDKLTIDRPFDGRGRYRRSWDASMFLRAAYAFASKHSNDPVTQNGAVLVSAEGSIIGMGANTFPKGVQLLPERLERPAKYAFMEHAERNAIYDAAKRGLKTEGGTLYCPYVACADCARAIIQAGIVKVVAHGRLMDKAPERWLDSIRIGDAMFADAGIEKTVIVGEICADSILFDGEVWWP